MWMTKQNKASHPPSPLFQGVSAVVLTDAAGTAQRAMGDVSVGGVKFEDGASVFCESRESNRHLFSDITSPLQADACKRLPAAVAPVVTLARAMLRELDGQVRVEGK